jgi:transposase-like protein
MQNMSDFHMRCQRCGAEMDMKDPAAGEAWRPDQYWVCPKCGRHFWTTYPNPPGQPAKATSEKPAGA